MSDKLQPKSADKELAKSISLNIHRRFLGFSGFRLFTQRVKGQNDEKACGYWVNRIFQILIGGFGLKFVGHLAPLDLRAPQDSYHYPKGELSDETACDFVSSDYVHCSGYPTVHDHDQRIHSGRRRNQKMDERLHRHLE